MNDIYVLLTELFLKVCSAGSRLLLQESIYDKFIEKIKERLTHIRIGPSMDKVIKNYFVINFFFN